MQLNIFEGITNNWLFLAIVGVIIVLQLLLVTFGSIAFGVYSYFGLTIQQWLICVSIFGYVDRLRIRFTCD